MKSLWSFSVIKQLAIKLHLWEEKIITELEPVKKATIDFGKTVQVDAGWFKTAMKHYCGTCEQWFKTASIATHNRFKHSDEK